MKSRDNDNNRGKKEEISFLCYTFPFIVYLIPFQYKY